MTSVPLYRRPQGMTAMVPPSWDQFAYDDIMQTVRREGRLDALGWDLVPAAFENQIPAEGRWPDEDRPSQQWKAAEKVAMGRAAQAQAEWEAARAARQEEQRQASDREWEARKERLSVENSQQWDLGAVLRGEADASTLPGHVIDAAGNNMCADIVKGRRSPFCPSFRVLIIEKRRRRYVAQGTTPEAALEHATMMAFREAKHYHRETKAAWYLDQRKRRHD